MANRHWDHRDWYSNPQKAADVLGWRADDLARRQACRYLALDGREPRGARVPRRRTSSRERLRWLGRFLCRRRAASRRAGDSESTSSRCTIASRRGTSARGCRRSTCWRSCTRAGWGPTTRSSSARGTAPRLSTRRCTTTAFSPTPSSPRITRTARCCRRTRRPARSPPSRQRRARSVMVCRSRPAWRTRASTSSRDDRSRGRAALRRRVQRGLGMGGGDVRGPPLPVEPPGHGRRERAAGIRRAHVTCSTWSRWRQVAGVRLRHARDRRPRLRPDRATLAPTADASARAASSPARKGQGRRLHGGQDGVALPPHERGAVHRGAE